MIPTDNPAEIIDGRRKKRYCVKCGGPNTGSRYSECKDCWAAYMKERLRAQTPEQYAKRSRRDRSRRIKHLYGITLNELEAMLEAQGGVCAVCGSDDPKYGKPTREGGPSFFFAVDHDHVSGRIRGILCHPCNRAIGQAGESSDRLRLLADYLDAANGTC